MIALIRTAKRIVDNVFLDPVQQVLNMLNYKNVWNLTVAKRE